MKLRSDFVSNSSSSSFIIRADEDYGIFRNDGTVISWEDYCDSYYGIRKDSREFLEYGYRYEYWDDGYHGQKHFENIKGKFTKQLIDVIKFCPDNEFIEKWLNSDSSIEEWFPESCKELVLKVIPMCQKLAEMENNWNDRPKDLEGHNKWLKDKSKLEQDSAELLTKIEWAYKDVLDKKCKKVKFLIASYSDHESGWAGQDDAESAMEYTLKNSKCKFQRIWGEH